MDAERARDVMLDLPYAEETVQWGGKLVFWAGNKLLGGKMFAIMDLDSPSPVIAFAAGQEHAAELCELDGFRPAPYLARAHWVAAERWSVLSPRVWEQELRAAYQVVCEKLPNWTQGLLSLPKRERAQLLAAREAARQHPAARQKEKTPSARRGARKKRAEL